MGTGWRRAFCTTFDPSQDHSENQHVATPDSPSPRNCVRLGFFSGGGNSSTPKKCNSVSPRSLSLFKNSFKFRTSCGICLESVKTGQGTAIYTAECGHAFHFPCITAHVHNNRTLLCPLCNATWHDLPLLASLNFTSYDDDEPLPGPSVDDNDVDDNDVEFQGFFVNRIPPPPLKLTAKERDLRDVEVKLLSESALISIGRSHETYATVLRVKAPKPDPAHRAPIDLVAVLDLSDDGAKLQMLKRAVTLLISSLGSADRLSLVASTKRLLPLRRMTADGQRAARIIADRIFAGQAINVGEALKKASKVLQDRREKNPVASIVLLSNGQDDGVQIKTSHVSSSGFTLIEIPVQYGEDALGKCVGGLLSLVAQDVRVQLSFASGSPPAEVTAVYSFNGGRPAVLGPTSVRLGDLYAGEDRELLVELRVPSKAIGAHHVMSVRSSYRHPATHHCKEQNLAVPVPQAVRSSSAPNIERLRNLFIATRAIAESRRLMGHGGDYSSAHRLLASARALIVHSSAIAGDDFARDLEAEMADLRHQAEEQKAATTPRRRWVEKEAAVLTDDNGEPLTPMSAWRAAEKLAKVAMTNKSLNRVSDLHGFESARF